MITIYHNPRCKKSRAGHQYLKDKGVEFVLREYLKDPLTLPELRELLVKLNLRPADLIRTQEEDFRKKLKGKKFTDEEWIRIILENPKLLKRPLVVSQYKAVWADPPQNMDILLK